jgi:iron complex transport system permease protein
MKVTVDIDKLLREGSISPADHARLKRSAATDTGSLALNLLLGFGVIATAAGTLVLLHSAPASVVLGVVLGAAGFSVSAQSPKAWGVLGSILLLVGSLISAGGVLVLTDGRPSGFMAVTALFLVAGIFARSGLLVALATLSLAHTVGAATGYGHAMYMLVIQEPTVTVVLFTLLSWVGYRWSLTLQPEFQRLALISARTSLLLVNFGFWVGSLWGDTPGRATTAWVGRSSQTIPDWAFALAWAAALIGAGSWAARENRRWVVNLVAVFGAIHFYTQYFERLGASPGTILTAGLVAIGIALALVRYNRTDVISRPPTPATSN